MTARTFAFALVVLLFAPPALAHGDAEANELEVEVLADEGNDFNDLRGGWDVTQVFVGEAHDHEVAHGPEGDLVYLRAELYGDPAAAGALAAGTWRADFLFDTPGGTIARSIRTSDGAAFETDFDALATNVSDGITHVTRAAILLGPNGLALGDALTNFRVLTYVDDEVRDVAPGGIPVAGPVEAPVGESAPSGEYALAGPTRYATASLEITSEHTALVIQSLLKQGSQHVHAKLPPGLRALDPAEHNLGPGETVAIRLEAATIPAGGATFDITTDIGGRITLTLATVDGVAAIIPAGESVPPSAPANDVPLPTLLPLLVAAALALALRRR